MKLSKISMLMVLVLLCGSLFAQTHTSVPLDNEVYYILDQAQLKGLCAPLSGIKPYPRSVVVAAINEILDSDKLNATEREILKQYLEKFAKPQAGMDWTRGGLFGETVIKDTDIPITANVQAGIDIEGSGGYYPQLEKTFFGTEIWVHVLVNGDIGSHVSYESSAEGGLMKAPRILMGTGNTYYDGFVDQGQYVDRPLDVYSEPLTHFPYTYKKRWDGSVYFFKNLAVFNPWPVDYAGGYNLNSELTLSFLDNKFITRLSRTPHEWGSVPFGSSLHLNQMARPFVSIESEFNPFSWFSIASMTGVLEYNQTDGIKESGYHNQKAYSISMLQFKYKNYFFLDLGEAVVWPKRFEIGYPSPITNSIFYQNNIGDFDNMMAMVDIKAQYPGIGNIWASLFWDEAFWRSDFNELDGTMIATQAGIEIALPFLAFSSLKFSYTKINPYCYTHNRNYNPWYGDSTMETAYTNNGVSLGYYTPPNSVEYLVRFKTMPAKSLMAHLQYQLIQHGADFGTRSVDGGNLMSELDPDGRHHDPRLRRYFLHDGAYQWTHIAKIGAEWTIPNLPVTLYGEAGAVLSYFTDTVGYDANNGKANPYKRINTSEYPESNGFVAQLGVKIFSR